MRKKLLSVALCATMVAGLLAGCGSSSKSDKASSDSKGSVYWLNFKPEADEALQGIAKTYEKENGVKVKVVTAASGNYNSTLTSEMGKSAAPTLFVVGNQAAVKTWDDYCIDLKDTDVYKELSTDAFNLKDENGKVASMGYCYESYGIIVNKKLLKKAGYEISDIKDFASLKSVAEDIHKRADKLGFDAFTSSGLDDASAWRFTGHLANMALFYEGRDDGWKEAPAEIKGTYLENFKNVWDLYINNSKYDKNTLATGGYDAEAEFKKGEAVFYQNGTWEYDALKKSISDDDMQMIPIYCGVEGEEKAGLCSGTENCWAVNAKASKADQKATLEFMKWLVTSKEGTKVMKEEGVRDWFCTLWQDDGAETPMETCLLSLTYFAECAYENEVTQEMLKGRMKELFGIDSEDLMLLDEFDNLQPQDPYNLKSANPSKLALYQDPMLGIFDGQFRGKGIRRHYEELAKKLEKSLERPQPEWTRHLLTYYQRLAVFLAEKAEMGLDLKADYDQHNQEKMREWTKRRIPQCLHVLEELWEMRETIWMSECKPQGYEVIDIRLGGVKSRLKSAARRIETWLSHPEKQLEELEEQRVCFWPDEDRIYSFNRWEQIVSASNINEL